MNFFVSRCLADQQQVFPRRRAGTTHHWGLSARDSFCICSPRSPASESARRSACLRSPALEGLIVFVILCQFHTWRRTRSKGPTPTTDSQWLKGKRNMNFDKKWCRGMYVRVSLLNSRRDRGKRRRWDKENLHDLWAIFARSEITLRMTNSFPFILVLMSSSEWMKIRVIARPPLASVHEMLDQTPFRVIAGESLTTRSRLWANVTTRRRFEMLALAWGDLLDAAGWHTRARLNLRQRNLKLHYPSGLTPCEQADWLNGFA